MNPKFTYLYSIDESTGEIRRDVVTRRSYKDKRRAKRRVTRKSRRSNR